MNRALLLRILIILGLTILLLVPLSMIQGVVSERQRLQDDVKQTIANSSAGAQRLFGPILVVPYTEHKTETTVDDKGKTIIHERHVELRAYFTPELLNIDGKVSVETRYKGIYNVLAFQHQVSVAATYQLPLNLGLEADPKQIKIGKAFLAFGLTDARGLRGSPEISVNGKSMAATPDTQFDNMGGGIHVDVDINASNYLEPIAAEMKFTQIGTSQISMALCDS